MSRNDEWRKTDSNAHFAATEFLKKSGITVKNKIPKRSIRTAIEDLQTDFSAICVLPIENSLEGIVRETIYNIQILNDKDIQIKGEITIPINHSLLANTTNKAEIKKNNFAPSSFSPMRKLPAQTLSRSGNR